MKPSIPTAKPSIPVKPPISAPKVLPSILTKVNQAPGELTKKATDATGKAIKTIAGKVAGSGGVKIVEATAKLAGKGAKAVPVVGQVLTLIEAGMVQYELNNLTEPQKMDYFRSHKQKLEEYQDGKVFGADLGIAGQAIDRVTGGVIEMIPTAVMLANYPSILRKQKNSSVESDVTFGNLMHDNFDKVSTSADSITMLSMLLSDYMMEHSRAPDDPVKLGQIYSTLPEDVVDTLDQFARHVYINNAGSRAVRASITNFKNGFARGEHGDPAYDEDTFSIYDDEDKRAFEQAIGHGEFSMNEVNLSDVINKAGDNMDIPMLLSHMIDISQSSDKYKTGSPKNFSQNLDVMYNDFEIGESKLVGRRSGAKSSNPVKASLTNFFDRSDTTERQYTQSNQLMLDYLNEATGTLGDFLSQRRASLEDMGITQPTAQGEQSISQPSDDYDYDEKISNSNRNTSAAIDALKPSTGNQQSSLLFQSGKQSPDVNMVSGKTITPGSLTSSVRSDNEELTYLVDVQSDVDVHQINQVNNLVKQLMSQTSTLEDLTTQIHTLNSQLPEEIQINTNTYVYSEKDNIKVDGITVR